MTFDEIKVGEKYALSRQVRFYNHREGMFAYFDDGLIVEVYRKNSEFATKTIMVKFPGGRIEVYARQLKSCRGRED